MSNETFNETISGFCDSEADDLANHVVGITVIPSWVYIIVMVLIALFLIMINIIFIIETYIKKTNNTVCQTNVMPEETPDYNLGMDTKYYTYVYASDEPPAAPAEPSPAVPTKTKQKTGATVQGKTTENADVFEE